MDSCVGDLPEVNKTPIVPAVNNNAAKWQAIVKAKREEIIAAKRARLPDSDSLNPELVPGQSHTVQIIDQGWFLKAFRAAQFECQDLVDLLVRENALNVEQERAFRLIANHANCKKPERLQMYLGGMGGTGKSQVLRTIAKFFELRNESHRFVVVAPTGTAASLLDGSTYHSVFGINGFVDGGYRNLRNDSATQARLSGVDYVFMDETSLLCCRDLYRISVSACRAL
ncbi:hypothetical protein FIBSPDRAFT_759192, partial [Athelia psychrophila]